MKRKHVFFGGLLIIALPFVMIALYRISVKEMIFPPFYDQNKISEVYRRGDLIIGGLEKYKTDNGSYPAELKELIPQYLPQVPDVSWGVGYWVYSKTETGFVINVWDNEKYHYPSIVKQNDGPWVLDQ